MASTAEPLPLAARRDQLVAACLANDAALVLRLISEDDETLNELLEFRNSRGRTALVATCYDGGGVEVVTLLLAAGADVEAQDPTGMTPLMMASYDGNVKVVDALLVAGARPEAQHPNGLTALNAASQNGHLEVVDRLLAAGARVNPANEDVPGLWAACKSGQLAVVDRLLAAGANTEVPLRDRSTSLFVACKEGHLEVVELLLAAGANPEVWFRTIKPIDLAAMENHSAIVELLSQPLSEAAVAAHQQRIREVRARLEVAGVPVNRSTDQHYALTIHQLPPLDARWDELVDACQREDLERIDWLLSQTETLAGTGALEELLEFKRPPASATVLLDSCFYGRVGAMNKLMAAGADIEAANQEGTRALLLASSQGHLAAVESLLAAGAHPNALRTDGLTALFAGCGCGHLEVVDRLLAAGANLAFEGWSPLCEASRNGHSAVVERLLAAGAEVDADEPDRIRSLMIASAGGHLAVVEKIGRA